jgi:hypothetical protein
VLVQTVTLFGAFHRVYYTSRGVRSSSYAYDIIWVFITVFSTCYRYVLTSRKVSYLSP